MKNIIAIVTVVLLSACSHAQVHSFESCVAAGNPVMESYPRQCAHKGKTYVEQVELQNKKPVCGEVEVQCIKAPCDPIKQTFMTRKSAEIAGAKNVVDGEC